MFIYQLAYLFTCIVNTQAWVAVAVARRILYFAPELQISNKGFSDSVGQDDIHLLGKASKGQFELLAHIFVFKCQHVVINVLALYIGKDRCDTGMGRFQFGYFIFQRVVGAFHIIAAELLQSVSQVVRQAVIVHYKSSGLAFIGAIDPSLACAR